MSERRPGLSQSRLPLLVVPLALAAVALLVVVAGVGGGSRDLPAPDFDAEILPLLQQNCATGGCHAGPRAWLGLDLTAGAAYAHLVGQPSKEVPSLLRVQPFKPDSSYLVQKLLGTQARGGRMPLKGEPLRDDQIALIIRWIEAGAPRKAAR